MSKSVSLSVTVGGQEEGTISVSSDTDWLADVAASLLEAASLTAAFSKTPDAASVSPADTASGDASATDSAALDAVPVVGLDG